MTKCGYAALVGAPNAGKSTLMNAVLGTKISIVSRKAQTTRSRMIGIHVHDDAQIIFIDTPGLFNPNKQFERAMVSSIWAGFDDADVVILLFDANKNKIDESTRQILEALKTVKKKAYLVLNKIDTIKKEKLLNLATEFSTLHDFDHIFMISALKESGLDQFVNQLCDDMPQGPFLYPEDQITDIPERLFAAETTREKIFNHLHDEIPYSTTVETDALENLKDGSLRVVQTIFVQNDRHKAIIVGKGGSTIKKIGELARHDLQDVLEKKVHINLFVKTKKNWQSDAEHYESLGLDF